jgi:small subunit ribosomal protein S20
MVAKRIDNANRSNTFCALMANTASAAKRARQIARRTVSNRRTLTAVKSQLKNVRAAIQAADKEKARAAAKQFVSAIDKAVKAGRLHRNAASRHKSSLNRALVRLA